MFPAMTDSAQHLRNAVKAFIERRKLSPSRVGRLLFGNPSFVRVLLGGRSPRLDTADRVLGFIGLEPIGPRFRREVDAYLTVTRAKATTVSEEAVKNRSFIRRLRNGSSPRLKTVDRMRAWMKRNASAEEWRMIEAAAGEEPRDEEVEGEDAASPASEEKPAEPEEAKPLYWTVAELAKVLRMSRSTLDRYRLDGVGPRYRKTRGKVLYARADVEKWLEKRGRSSTSDPGDDPPGGRKAPSDEKEDPESDMDEERSGDSPDSPEEDE